MSKRYDPSIDRDNWYSLGSTVEFDGPYGTRMRGEIVRSSSNPDYYHVQVDGVRYEVSLNGDNMEMVWD